MEIGIKPNNQTAATDTSNKTDSEAGKPLIDQEVDKLRGLIQGLNDLIGAPGRAANEIIKGIKR